jgi:hypothetical protein
MCELYRVVWKNPENGRMCSGWWELSKENVEKEKERIEKELNVECTIETLKA